jgi:hypothetical protein
VARRRGNELFTPRQIRGRGRDKDGSDPLLGDIRKNDLDFLFTVDIENGCSSAGRSYRCPLHRRELGHGAHPGGELRAAGSEIAEAAFARNIKSHGEN